MCIQVRLYTMTTHFPTQPVRRRAIAMPAETIGELEHLILLTILNHPEEGTALNIRRTLEAQADRRLTRGALYRALDRLADKGFIRWEVHEPTAERGGHTRRVYEVSPAGLAVVQERRAALERLWAGAPAMRSSS